MLVNRTMDIPSYERIFVPSDNAAKNFTCCVCVNIFCFWIHFTAYSFQNEFISLKIIFSCVLANIFMSAFFY